MKKQPCIQMLASRKNGTLYIGVNSDLLKREYWSITCQGHFNQQVIPDRKILLVPGLRRDDNRR